MEPVVNLPTNKLYDALSHTQMKNTCRYDEKNCADYVFSLFWWILYLGGVMLHDGNGDWGDLGLKNRE